MFWNVSKYSRQYVHECYKMFKNAMKSFEDSAQIYRTAFTTEWNGIRMTMKQLSKNVTEEKVLSEKEKRKTTVGSKIIRALEIIRVNKLIPNAV